MVTATEGPRFSDDVDTPGGRPPVVLDPIRSDVDGAWRVFSWPEPDVPAGTVVALRVPFPATAGETFLANGWQSWSAPTLGRLGAARGEPPLRGLSRRHLLRLAGAPDAGYDVLATAGAVVGFRSGGGLLVAEVEEGAVYAVRRHVGAPHPPVWVAQGDGPALLDDLLEGAGGRPPRTRPVGWSTWEAFHVTFDEERLGRVLHQVGTLAADGLCDIAMVDDGWQRTLGDWTADPLRFPGGLAGVAGRAHEAGVAAGLWTAPLLVSSGSETASAHPEWIVRSPGGRPVVGAVVGHWGPETWILDATLPAVRDHLAAQAAAHAAAGFSTFKLDFLYAAADAADAAVARRRAGEQHPGDLLASDEVLVAVLEAIGAGGGEQVSLLGCGAPLWPAIGHVDWMRVGPDVTRYLLPTGTVESDPAMAACLSNGWRSARLRSPMHRRLWGNDPDAVILSGVRGDVTRRQRLDFGRWVADSGGLLTLSDDLADLTSDDLTVWADLVERSRRAPAVGPSRALAEVLDGEGAQYW